MKTVTLFVVNDSSVVNAVLFNPEINEFEYLKTDEIEKRLTVLREKGYDVKVQEIAMGEEVTIPIDAIPQDYPDRGFAHQKVSATISTIPRRYRESDIPKELLAEGITVDQYAQLMGEKELVVDIHERRLLKNPLEANKKDSSDLKDDLFNNSKNHQNKLTDAPSTMDLPTQPTPRPAPSPRPQKKAKEEKGITMQY